MPRQICRGCGGTEVYYDYGAEICIKCGNVMEESGIVAEVTFGEASNGAAMAYGKNVPAGGDRAGGGPLESRQQLISNGKAKIREVAASMKLSAYIEERARRHFSLCVAINFIKGRSSQRVAAACLYISCRESKTSHMLIDFSDKLRINVFELGATYTKLVRSLHLEGKLPLVDPAHYIGRFAALLEFGAETQKVAQDAMRLVARFDKDWLRVGRRPSGICGACLLLAARMNNFRRSVEEIVQVVKIADTTIKKRLEEFKNTPSGALTVQDFRSLWLEQNADPPAFSRGKEKRLREEAIEDQSKKANPKAVPVGDKLHSEGDDAARAPKKARTNGNPGQGQDGGTVEHDIPKDAAQPVSHLRPNSVVSDGVDDADEGLQLDDTGFLETFDASPTADDPDFQRIAQEVEDHLREGENIVNEMSGRAPPENTSETENTSGTLTESTGERRVERDDDIAAPTNEEAREPEAPGEIMDTLEDIGDEEVDMYLCTPEEVTRKTRLWIEFNLQYLEALAAKGLDHQTGIERKKKRSKPAKPKDSSAPAGETPAEAATKLIGKKKAVSKRINYEAVSALLSSEIPKNKSHRKDRDTHSARRKERDKSRHSSSAVGEGDDNFFGSDGEMFPGLERMSEAESDWSTGRNEDSAVPYSYDNNDGYDTDDYQQEA